MHSALNSLNSLNSQASVKSEHVLNFPHQPPGLYPDKLELQESDSLYGPLG